jgi:putative membrane protein
VTDSAAPEAVSGAPAITAPRRLHPLTPFARGWQVVAVLFVLMANNMLGVGRWEFLLIGLAIVIPIGSIYGYLSWRFTRWWIEEGVLRLETGVLFRRSRQVRLDRLQAVDIVRPLIARFIGLAELRLETAGAGETEATLAYLSEKEAREVRAELLARAAGLKWQALGVPTEADADASPPTAVPASAPEAPERVITQVPTGTLLASLLLDVGTILGAIYLVVLVVLVFWFDAPGLFALLVPAVLGVGGATFGTFSRYFDFTVATSPDGLRLRHGLLETRAQTVPPGRIQAIRLSQPLLWRRFGWARLDVNVAGYSGDSGQSKVSTLLPVAPRPVAVGLLDLVLPGVQVDDIPLEPAPRRARWLNPLQGRYLAVGANDAVFVVRSGWVNRRLIVAPHPRTQSVRLTQGPLQRAGRLGTVHLDVTPGPVSVRALDRDVNEGLAIVEAQAERARVARQSAGPERWMEARTVT